MTALAFLLGMAAGGALVAAGCARARRRRSARVAQLTDYLESAALGRAKALTPTGEDDLSRLQDEMGKTVMALERTRAEAVAAKDGFARNLASIAHQVKTPLSAIALAARRIDGCDADEDRHAAQAIIRQAERLDRLQGDLLLMAKLDAGVLEMRPDRQDVYTLLCQAAESLGDYAAAADVSIDVIRCDPAGCDPAGCDDAMRCDPAEVLVDGHWACEALMNVMKNCVEHAPAGSSVRVEYEAGPLYVEVLISDEGPGFAPGEEARLFERFYTGTRHAAADARAAAGALPATALRASAGTGLGLAFARELLERQDASIRARRPAAGGACFEIRLYGHPDVTLAP